MNAGLISRRSFRLFALGAAAVAALAPSASNAGAATYGIGPIAELSGTCSGQNAEIEQAADAAAGYVYEVWMGCRGIAFARSTDSGQTFQAPISVPGSVGSNVNSWDPAVAVAPDGTVYAAFMISRSSQW